MQLGDHIGGIIDRQRGLGEEGQRGVCGESQRGDILQRFDQGHRAFGYLPQRADNFGMAAVADEQDVAPGLDLPLGLAVHLADQRAGRIEPLEPARAGGFGHHLGHAMR